MKTSSKTDASMFKATSGALLDTKGRLVGMNIMIISQTGLVHWNWISDSCEYGSWKVLIEGFAAS